MKISTCDNCSSYLNDCIEKSGSEPMNDDERVRELELELAQTKLAHVEAECRNQVRIAIKNEIQLIVRE